MVDIWFLNIEKITEEEFDYLLDSVPLSVQNEVKRYRFIKDKKFKLFGKLLVKEFYEKNGQNFSWSDWKVDQNKKPFISKGKHFNVTHSGDYVAVAFSDREIGIDLEIVKEINHAELSDYFHPKEKAFIESSINKLDSFYYIWTRKEAYLKAIGIGVLKGLDNENSLVDINTDSKKWFIYSPSIFCGYQQSFCSTIENCSFEIEEIDISKLKVTKNNNKSI